MESLWGTILTVIGSIGGVGIIIIGISSWIGKILSERYSKKYQFILEKELEEFKQDLYQKSNYDKTRFEKEFEVYGVLLAKCYEMITSAYRLFPKFIENITSINPQQVERYNYAESEYNKAVEKRNEFTSCLYHRAIFISEEIFESFSDLHKRASWQYDSYKLIYWDESISEEKRKELFNNAWHSSIELVISYEELLKRVRSSIRESI